MFLKESLIKHRFFLPVGAILCCILWGSAFPSIKTAYQHLDTSNLSLLYFFAGLRFTLAGLMVLAFTSGKRESLRQAPMKHLFIIMITQIVLQYLCFYWSLSQVSGVLGAILTSTGSFWWVLLAPIVDRREKMKLVQYACILLGGCGVMVAVYFSKSSGGESNPLGIVGFLFCTLCGAIAAIFVRPAGEKVSMPFISGTTLFVGGLILLLFGLSGARAFITSMNTTVFVLLIYLAFVSAFSFSLWFLLIRHYDVARLSAYRFLIPICGVLESVLFLANESLNFLTIVGAAIVLVSIYCLEKTKRGNKAKSNAVAKG